MHLRSHRLASGTDTSIRRNFISGATTDLLVSRRPTRYPCTLEEHSVDDPFSCDTSVAVGSATFDGSVIFAKNSDRRASECQPLVHAPRRQHPPGTTLRTQYLEIPQVAETWELIGSRPHWLWGFEIGVNEWG